LSTTDLPTAHRPLLHHILTIHCRPPPACRTTSIRNRDSKGFSSPKTGTARYMSALTYSQHPVLAYCQKTIGPRIREAPSLELEPLPHKLQNSTTADFSLPRSSQFHLHLNRPKYTLHDLYNNHLKAGRPLVQGDPNALPMPPSVGSSKMFHTCEKDTRISPH